MFKTLLRSPLGHGFVLLLLLLLSNPSLAQLTIQVEGENIPCFGLSNGSATAVPLNGAGPFSYLWSNGEDTATIDGLPAGMYSVTVTDNLGATGTGEITLTQPPRLQATEWKPGRR